MANINVLRSNLIIYETYYGASRWLGQSTIDLPEFAANTTDVSGPGIAGDFSMPSPGMFENSELTIHWRTPHVNLTELLAFKAHTLTLMGALNDYETATGTPKQGSIKIVVRGVPQKMTLGKFEKASETESESTLNIDYIKIWIGGEEVIEYDKFNYVFRVNGVDYLSGTRTAIGR